MDLGAEEKERSVSNREWQVAPNIELLLAHWADEEEAVVYHSGSGNTYLINDLARRVIMVLQGSSSTIIEICDRLSANLGLIPQQEKLDLLENLLTDLLKVDAVRFRYR